MAGKGDRPRKVDGEKFRANYDAIFRKKKPAAKAWNQKKYPNRKP